MTVISILDTGYISNTTLASMTQLTDAQRAGYTGSAVSAITLKVQNLSLSGQVNIEDKPIIGSLTDNSASVVSVNPRSISVSCILAKSIVTSGWNINNLYQIMRLDRTYGLKLLYIDAADAKLPSIVEALGQANVAGNFSSASPSADNGTVSTTTPYLVGRIRGMTLTDSEAGDYWRISFEFLLE